MAPSPTLGFCTLWQREMEWPLVASEKLHSHAIHSRAMLRAGEEWVWVQTRGGRVGCASRLPPGHHSVFAPCFWNYHGIQQYTFSFFLFFTLLVLYSSLLNGDIEVCVLGSSWLSCEKSWAWTLQVTQQMKTLATESDDGNSIPRNHTRERENRLLRIVLWLPHSCSGMHMPTDI